RAQKSNTLQKWLFRQYTFLNGKGENKSLLDIFDDFSGILPPAGAGECVAPKLFQYAYVHQLKPITFAEFWWGKSPASEIRKHMHFYPSCRGKCEPILGHMLEGIAVDPNPMLENPADGKTIRILFEDEYLAVIHKPHEFLSVPGKTINDSVYERVKGLFPGATGPLCVHRLDMSTSGLMLIAKDLKTHEKLQRQFLNKTIKKRYVAILDGELSSRKGEINLPLRVDLNNRPQQMVCYEHGKEAKTFYEVLSIENNQTKIYFYPITGRTHQLRVHAAHPEGLNAPIKGDDLYGERADRLYLQAQRIEFFHPVRKETIVVEDEKEF
ncbi:MAG: RluA family pseudouridine synthase, partial [Crocinitomicaceae bacterium]|nr:RluA family pseudouridine synthase [Crocinitomicaceae bacterium]